MPVFGLVLLGWVLAKTRRFDAAATRGLSLFVFNVAIPVMLAHTLAGVTLPARPDWALLVTYFTSAFIVFALAAAFARMRLGRAGATAGVFGFTASFSNLVILGIPLVLDSLGEQATVPLFLLVAFHSPLLMTLTTVVAEAGRGAGLPLARLPLAVGRSLVGNPIFMGLAAGLLLNLLRAPIPSILDRFATYLADASLPCALFALGANLAAFQIRAAVPAALVLTLLKGIVHPLLVLAIGTLILPLSPMALAVAVVVATGPAGINAYLFASRYDTAIAEATSTVLLSTALSVVTLSLVLTAFAGP